MDPDKSCCTVEGMGQVDSSFVASSFQHKFHQDFIVLLFVDEKDWLAREQARRRVVLCVGGLASPPRASERVDGDMRHSIQPLPAQTSPGRSHLSSLQPLQLTPNPIRKPLILPPAKFLVVSRYVQYVYLQSVLIILLSAHINHSLPVPTRTTRLQSHSNKYR
jgi:hypothetical protein